MSKLSQLQGKKKKYTIGDIEIELYPLTLDEMGLIEMNENSSQEAQIQQSKKLLTTVLKKAIPDATEEEIDNLGGNYLNELMTAIMDVNGLNKQKKGMKDVIAERQQAIRDKAKTTGPE